MSDRKEPALPEPDAQAQRIADVRARIEGLRQRGALICEEWQELDGMPVSCKRCGYTREVHLLRDALSVIDAQAQALAAAEAARDEVQRRLTDALGALDESNALALRQGHRAQQAEAQRLALTQALERLRGYATHKADCPRFYVRGSHDPFPDKPCDCGLDAALAAPSGTPPTNQGT